MWTCCVKRWGLVPQALKWRQEVVEAKYPLLPIFPFAVPGTLWAPVVPCAQCCWDSHAGCCVDLLLLQCYPSGDAEEALQSYTGRLYFVNGSEAGLANAQLSRRNWNWKYIKKKKKKWDRLDYSILNNTCRGECEHLDRTTFFHWALFYSLAPRAVSFLCQIQSCHHKGCGRDSLIFVTPTAGRIRLRTRGAFRAGPWECWRPLQAQAEEAELHWLRLSSTAVIPGSWQTWNCQMSGNYFRAHKCSCSFTCVYHTGAALLSSSVSFPLICTSSAFISCW